MVDKEKIKAFIEQLEVAHNGLSRVNGGDVRIVNMKIYEHSNLITGDLILFSDGDHVERDNGCEWNLQAVLDHMEDRASNASEKRSDMGPV